LKFYKTLKFRINLWYLMLLAIALLFFSILSFHLLDQRVSMMNLDTVKISVLQTQIPSSVISESPDGLSKSSNEYKLLFSYVITAEQVSEIRSSSYSSIEVLSEEGLFTFNEKEFISSEMEGDQQIWLYYRPVAGESASYDLLAVTQSKNIAFSMLNSYKQVLYIAIPITLLLAGLLGYFLIRRFLHPLGLITKASGEINEKDLERRIEFNSNDELGELSNALNKTFDSLHKSFEREHGFASDTSHELRTPLAIMQGEASLALNQSRNKDEYRRHLESISNQIMHMSSIVSKLLFLSRSQKNMENLNIEEVSLNDILDDVIALTRLPGEEKQLIFQKDIAKDIVVEGDVTRLREVFLNLVDNAIRYTPPRGSITISAVKQNSSAAVTIKDTGTGISPEHLPHIFDRFYRVGNSEDYRGSGLGLAICKCIAEMHQGRIEVESRVGEGSSFTVVLPLTHD
jgi:heavy metal sensor kinase